MHEAGMEVRALDFRQIWSQRAAQGLVNDIVHCSITFDPHFILINKGERFTAEILKEIKKSVQAPIFLFYGDKRESWPSFLFGVLRHYDAFLINSDDENEKATLEQYKPQRVLYHHSATDTEIFKKNEEVKEDVDVAFFGSNYNVIFPESKKRRDWMLRLALEPDISVRLYGHGWDGSAYPVTFGADYAAAASRAKMLIGFNAFDNIRLYTSNRCFNSMACGTFLSTKWKGCETMFEGGKELEWFTSYREMVSKVRKLKSNKRLRQRIYKAGRKRLEKDHTYTVRARELEQIYNQIRPR